MPIYRIEDTARMFRLMSNNIRSLAFIPQMSTEQTSEDYCNQSILDCQEETGTWKSILAGPGMPDAYEGYRHHVGRGYHYLGRMVDLQGSVGGVLHQEYENHRRGPG